MGVTDGERQRVKAWQHEAAEQSSLMRSGDLPLESGQSGAAP